MRCPQRLRRTWRLGRLRCPWRVCGVFGARGVPVALAAPTASSAPSAPSAPVAPSGQKSAFRGRKSAATPAPAAPAAPTARQVRTSRQTTLLPTLPARAVLLAAFSLVHTTESIRSYRLPSARSYSSPLSGLTWSGILRGGGMWHQPLQLAGRGERARFAGTLIKLLRSRPRPAKGGRLPEKGRFALADATLPSCHAPAGEPRRQVFADPSCFRRLLGGRHPPNLK